MHRRARVIMLSGVEFRLFGIPVAITGGFWLTAFLLGLLNAGPSGATARLLPSVLVVLVAILVHELGHALVASVFGARPMIVLHGMGGTTRLEQGKLSRWRSVLVSLAGPFAGFVVGGLSVAARHTLTVDGELLRFTLGYLEFCTIGWGILNLMPVLPLDGGLVMRDALGPSRLRIALWLSAFFGAGLCVLALSQKWLWLVFLFGFGAYQSVRAALALPEAERRTAELSSELAKVLAVAQQALDRGAFDEAMMIARTVIEQGLTPEGRDAGRRVFAAAALEAGRGALALECLRTLEQPTVADDVLRAQGLDLVGERAAAFALLEMRTQQTPEGPALEPLLRGLVATGQLDRALFVARSYLYSGSVDALSWFVDELYDDGSFGDASALSLGLFDRTKLADFAYRAARANARAGALENALSALESAVSAGFDDPARIRRDDDLKALHDDPRYERLLDRLSGGRLGS